MTILPSNVRCSVKNIKHHKILSTPLVTNKIDKKMLILLFLIKIHRIIADNIYTIVQTIGIKTLGIHCDGLISPLNQSIPKFTNTLPSPATIITPTTASN